METNESSRSSRARKILLGWPVTLATLTLALLFVAGRVSAWHRGARDDSPERWKAHAARVLDRLLGDLEASDEQATTIHGLAAEIMDRLDEARDRHDEARDAWHALLGAETVDPSALEALRVDQLAQADTVSAEVLAKLTTILETLTPAQRRELVDRLADLRAFHGRHPSGFHHGRPRGLFGGHDGDRPGA